MRDRALVTRSETCSAPFTKHVPKKVSSTWARPRGVPESDEGKPYVSHLLAVH